MRAERDGLHPGIGSEIKVDPDTLRALAEARDAVRAGDVVYGTEAVRTLFNGRRAS